MASGVGRRERKKVETRRALIRAAMALVSQSGSGAGVADIAEEADVALGTFYNYFESKDDLLDELAREVATDFETTVSEAMCSFADPAVALVAGVRSAMAWFEADPVRAQYVLKVAAEDPRMRLPLREWLVEVVLRGHQLARFRCGDPMLACATVGGAVLGVLWARSQEMVAPLVASDELPKQVLRLVGVPDEEAPAVIAEVDARLAAHES